MALMKHGMIIQFYFFRVVLFYSWRKKYFSKSFDYLISNEKLLLQAAEAALELYKEDYSVFSDSCP